MNYQDSKDLKIAKALRDELGLSFILLAHMTWFLLPNRVRCNSWRHLSEKLDKWASADSSRLQVAERWKRVWLECITSDVRGLATVLDDSLEFLVDIASETPPAASERLSSC